MDDELVDQDFAAGPQLITRAHDVSDSLQSRGYYVVTAGLVPAIHVVLARGSKDVDARHKAGHDGGTLGGYRLIGQNLAGIISLVTWFSR